MEQRFLPGMSPGLVRVMERAQEDPDRRLLALAHHIDVTALRRAYNRLQKETAVGVDGVTKQEYGQELESNLEDLHNRLKTMRYRHQPIRRAHIPKGKGQTRPIGICCIEDKIVQGALRELLETIYEQDFLDCSYGFRPRRSAHDAIRALDRAVLKGEARWILEADIRSFFDELNRSQLKEMLQRRVNDKSLMRLVGKCLHVGILDGEEFSRPEEGTVQGSVLSPLLGNIYLHYALDRWFEREIRPRLKGRSVLVRFADDFICGFERRDDAERVLGVLGKRLGRFGLRLHPEKTRLVDFRRPPRGRRGGKGPGTFDFLGFTVHWRWSGKGRWTVSYKTRRVRLGQAITKAYDWCRRHRHLTVPEQHMALTRRIRGHFNYFGVDGNERSLNRLNHEVRRAWYKWLNRRSQRSRLNWERFGDLLRDFPLPKPRVYVKIWGCHP